jgi:hypothetical protein
VTAFYTYPEPTPVWPARACGDNRRALKTITGPKLRARSLPAQQGETAIAVEVLNQMIRIAKPPSVRFA